MIIGWWQNNYIIWNRLKISFKKIKKKVEKICYLFREITGDYPDEIIGLILCFVDPRDFLIPLLKGVVGNMRELTKLYWKEHEEFYYGN